MRRFEDELGEARASGLRRRVKDLEARIEEARRAIEGRRPPPEAPRLDDLIGPSPLMQAVRVQVRRAAAADLPVLVTGETGTGKDLACRVVHGESPRRERPFVSITCAALPAELLEAELFGYVRGAFSGAEKDHEGLLRSAHGGAVLLDEVAELPLSLQAKLLRVLEQRRIRPLGGIEEVEVDIRCVSTTSRDLLAMLREGTFRQDLFYRLRGLEVRLPPLRDRIEDLPALVEHFRRRAALSPEDAPAFSAEALRALAAHSWPGNIRELANAVVSLALTTTERIGAAEVGRFLMSSASAAVPQGVFPRSLLLSQPLDQMLACLEREYLILLYREKGGDLEAVARTLGIQLRALFDRFKRLGIRSREIALRCFWEIKTENRG